MIYRYLAVKITDFLILNKAANENEREIYTYGLELSLSSILIFFGILIIGFMFGRIPQLLFFILIFCPLRLFAGGIHAKNHIRCSLYFYAIITVFLLLERNIKIQMDPFILPFVFAGASTAIAVLAPVADHNKPLKQCEKSVSWKRTLSLLAFWNVIVIACALGVLPMIFPYPAFSLFAIVLLTVMMMIGSLKNKERRDGIK